MVEERPESECPQSVKLEQTGGDLSTLPDLAGHVANCPRCQTRIGNLQEEEALAARLRQAVDLEREVALRKVLEAGAAGDYEIGQMIGRGAHGVVFQARDVKLNRAVAIKCLYGTAGDDRVEAVLREARNLARINHPGIAAIYAVSSRPEAPFIVMELVEGRPITDALAQRPLAEQVKAFSQVLAAVAELHRRGVVHHDLKPGNILVDSDGRAKLLDFGIAHAPGTSGRVEGTPAYLAPEQSLAQPAHPTADVFSLGIILFELLTGQRPFAGQTPGQVVQAIRSADPPLPRSLRAEIPGALQAICLTALEKEPSRRYASAGAFLLDLERFVRGEAVWADPKLLVTVLEHGIDRHVADLQRWRNDRLISTREYDYFADRYGKLRQREEFWVLDSRRISFTQVMLHLGVWACVVSAFLMLAFPWTRLGSARLVLPGALLPAMLGIGLLLWQRRTNRVAAVMLIGAAMVCPIAVATALVQWHVLEGGWAPPILERIAANRQLLAATATGLALALALWWRTRTAAFALICGAMLLAVSTAAFALMGLRTRLELGRADIVAGWYLMPALALLFAALAWDLRWRVPSFATPLYAMGVAVAALALSLVAWFGPTPRWLGLASPAEGPHLSRQIQYSFMINGALYLAAGLAASRSRRSASLRRIGTILLWLAPTHILLPLLRLENEWPLGASGWTIPEALLPLGALAFVFASVLRQMKSFFFSGLFYLAVGVQRLTARHFENAVAWPVALAALGAAMTVLAWRFPTLFQRNRAVARGRSGPAPGSVDSNPRSDSGSTP